MFNSLAEFRAYVDRYYLQGTWKDFLKSNGPVQSMPLENIVREFYCRGLSHKTSFFSRELERTFKKMLPYLQERKDRGLTSRILSLPCSRGQEVYSLAILADQAEIKNCRVEGRDVCPTLIDIASNQQYWIEQERKDLLQPYLEEGYFWIERGKRKNDGTHNLKIAPNITHRCDFFVHDLLLDQIPAEYQAVLCLNLFMHLSPEGRTRAVENLTSNLEPGCRLFLGDPYEVNLGYHRGWNLERQRRNEYNRFIEGLEERPELRLRKVGRPNIYQKY